MSAMTTQTKLTLEQFWALLEGETAYELVDGQAIPKVSPKEFHSALQGALYRLIFDWRKGKGRVYPEWAVTLKRNGVPWVPTPDVTYISYEAPTPKPETQRSLSCTLRFSDWDYLSGADIEGIWD